MKKVALLLCAVLLLSLFAGCSKKSDTVQVMSFSEFDEKYRRADYEALLNDSTAFLRDLAAVNRFTSDSPEDVILGIGWSLQRDFSVDSEDGSSYLHYYKKECVLFNHSMNYEASVFHNVERYRYTISVEYTGVDDDDTLSFAKSLYFGLISIYGDPSEIELDWKESAEPALLRVLNGNDPLRSFYVTFGNDAVLSFYEYSNYVSVSVYPDSADH